MLFIMNQPVYYAMSYCELARHYNTLQFIQQREESEALLSVA